MRGEAVGPAEERGQPVLLGVSTRFDRGPGLGARDHGREGDPDEIERFPPPGAFGTRVDQVGEVRVQRHRCGRRQDAPRGLPSAED